jgi:hypothetical protein
MQTIHARTRDSRIRVAVLFLGIFGIVSSVWPNLDARQVASAPLPHASNWLDLNGRALTIRPPVMITQDTIASDGMAIVLAAPTGSFPSGPIVCIIGPDGSSRDPKLAYSISFGGGVRVSAGDVNNDGVVEYVTGPASAAPTIPLRLFSGPGIANFLGEGFLFTNEFSGGVNLRMADVTGDRRDDIIAAPGIGGPPLVRIVEGNGRFLSEFFAFDPAFRGGVNVAAGDIDGDGVAEIFTGAASGPGEVRAWRTMNRGMTWGEFGRGTLFNAPTSGVFVTVGDVNGDGRADLVAGAGPGGPPRVVGVDVAGGVSFFADFLPFESSFSGGVRVAVGDVNGDGSVEIITASGPGRVASIRAYAFRNGTWMNQIYTNTTQFGSNYNLGLWVTAKTIRLP